ncbi:MAG: hypothetical protein WD048_15280 [Chitinophagales bacterium]
MSELQPIIDIIQIVREKITDETDVIWAGYDNPTELQDEIDKELNELKSGNLEMLDKFKNRFLPTATFQEISLSNGWGDEFIKLSDRFDKLYKRVRK